MVRKKELAAGVGRRDGHSTVSCANLLVTLPEAFVAVTVYDPASVARMVSIFRTDEVAASMGVAFLYHWSDGFGIAATRISNCAVSPVDADTDSGCDIIIGGIEGVQPSSTNSGLEY